MRLTQGSAEGSGLYSYLPQCEDASFPEDTSLAFVYSFMKRTPLLRTDKGIAEDSGRLRLAQRKSPGPGRPPPDLKEVKELMERPGDRCWRAPATAKEGQHITTGCSSHSAPFPCWLDISRCPSKSPHNKHPPSPSLPTTAPFLHSDCAQGQECRGGSGSVPLLTTGRCGTGRPKSCLNGLYLAFQVCSPQGISSTSASH